MKFTHLLLFAAGVPLLAAAQADRDMPAAADPSAPVTPLQYHSVFADCVPDKPLAQSPDKRWTSAASPTPSRMPSMAGPMHPIHQHEGARQ